MRLKVLLPTEILLDIEAVKIVAEAENGAFGLLPRHVDFVTALAPGLLTYTTPTGEEAYVAVDEGVLLKRGAEVSVSTRRAARGRDLGTLRQVVEEQFHALDEHERQMRFSLSRLEADLVRRLMELEKSSRA